MCLFQFWSPQCVYSAVGFLGDCQSWLCHFCMYHPISIYKSSYTLNVDGVGGWVGVGFWTGICPLPKPPPLPASKIKQTFLSTRLGFYWFLSSKQLDLGLVTIYQNVLLKLSLKKNTFESVLIRWMKLEPIIRSEVSQKEKYQYSTLTHIYGI